MGEPTSHAFHTRTLHGQVVGGVVAAVGVALLFFPEAVVADAKLIGTVMIALGAGVYLTATRSAAAKRPRLIVSDEGVWYRDWGLDVVPWGEIARVYARGTRFKTTICVELEDPEGFLADMAPAKRSRLTSNPLTRPPLLRVPIGTLNATFDELLAALRSGL